MSYVLDTNICIYYLRGDFPHLRQHVADQPVGRLAVSSITVAELYFGVCHSTRVEANLKALAGFLSELTELPFGHEAAELFGRIKQDLSRKGKVVGPHDLLIAATVMTRGHTLVTHNVAEFSMIDDLRIEDWTKRPS